MPTQYTVGRKKTPPGSWVVWFGVVYFEECGNFAETNPLPSAQLAFEAARKVAETYPQGKCPGCVHGEEAHA